jgi:hypothetical protein
MAMMPPWFIKHRRAVFSVLANVTVVILAIVCAHFGNVHKDDGHQHWGAYLLAMIIALAALPIEWAVDRRNPELTKDLRFDLAGAIIALAIIRIEATRLPDAYDCSAGEGGRPCSSEIPWKQCCTDGQIYFKVDANGNTKYRGLQIGIDLIFFLVFLGAKLVGRHGSRELAMLVMADIVDFIELTFSMVQTIRDPSDGGQGFVLKLGCAPATSDAIVAFTFIFALVTLLLQRAEGPGQKALNALVQGLAVHLPIICIRLAIPLNEGNAPSFNVVFIVKNIVELVGCGMDFLDAGSEVRATGSSYDPV